MGGQTKVKARTCVLQNYGYLRGKERRRRYIIQKILYLWTRVGSKGGRQKQAVRQEDKQAVRQVDSQTN